MLDIIQSLFDASLKLFGFEEDNEKSQALCLSVSDLHFKNNYLPELNLVVDSGFTLYKESVLNIKKQTQLKHLV